MFDARLMRMVPEARRLIAADVALQWAALLANTALFAAIGLFFGALVEGTLESSFSLALAGAALCAIAVRFICQKKAAEYGARAASAAKCTIRQRVYDKLVSLGPGYADRTATARALHVCVEGSEQLESYFGSYVPQLFYAVLAPVTLFCCLAPFSLPAAVALVACVPLIPLSIVAIQRIAKRIMRGYWGSYVDLGETFLENIRGLATLKVFSADGRAHDRMNDQAESFRRSTMRLLRMQLNSITVMDLFAFGGAAVGIVAAIGQYADGAIGLGPACVIVLLSAEFFLPLRTLGSFFHTAMNGMAAADAMYEILDTPDPAEGSRRIERAAGVGVRCASLGYVYEDSDHPALASVDFEAPVGSFVGIAGESGSGKSTLAGVIAGTHAGFSGALSIGGIDAHDLARSSWSESVCLVSYSNYLFKGTIAENMRLASPHASVEEIWNALERCRVADFVRARGGLESCIDAGGGDLSGGQRQRIALARALLRDASVYVFDEATSNIDAESEAAIASVMHALTDEGKTVIAVSHRLALLRGASCIYAMQGGRVVERGCFDELAACDGGVFARLWNTQKELERIACAGASTPCAACDEPAGEEGEAHDYVPSKDEGATARVGKGVVMARLLALASPLAFVMTLAVFLGVAGFAAAIFVSVGAAFALLELTGFETGVAASAWVGLLVACALVRGPLRYGEQLCNHYVAFKVLALVRNKVFAQLRRLAPAKLDRRDQGDLVSLVTADVELLEVFFAHTISPVAIACIVSIGMTVFIAAQNPMLGAIALLSYIAVGAIMPLCASRAGGDGARDVRDGIGALNAFVLDSLNGLRETLQFGGQRARAAELKRRMRATAQADMVLKRRAATAFAATGACVLACDAAMMAASAALAHAHVVSPDQALLACVALFSSFGPVIALANLGSTLQGTLASGSRVLELLDESPQTEEVENGVVVEGFSGVRFDGVTFSYGSHRVLENVDMTIAPGSVVRIVGKSGAGKSTLLKMIMRFWDPDSGTVSISGVDARNVNTESLRAEIGFMTQHTHLFPGTVRDNLLIASPDAGDEELYAALEKASLRARVERLPHGLDGVIGACGEGLSGGERQRLGLARLFLRDAGLLLLDEPTSNLDSLNEAAILRALRDHGRGCAMAIVSHRPAMAALAAETYVLASSRSC